MTDETVVNSDIEHATVLPVSSTGSAPPQQAIHDGYISTIRKQREAALDTVANLVGERDFLLSRVQLLEREAAKVPILVQEVSNLQYQVQQIKAAHVFSDSKSKSDRADNYHNMLNP